MSGSDCHGFGNIALNVALGVLAFAFRVDDVDTSKILCKVKRGITALTCYSWGTLVYRGLDTHKRSERLKTI